MQFIEAEKTDHPGITAYLNNMEISDSIALGVEAQNVDTARSTIVRFHKNTNKRFTTKKAPNGGIMIWREADALPVETDEKL